MNFNRLATMSGAISQCKTGRDLPSSLFQLKSVRFLAAKNEMLKVLFFISVFFVLTQQSFADSSPVTFLSTEKLLTLNVEDRAKFQDSIRQMGNLAYGPLFTFGEDSRLFISFGIEMSDSRTWKVSGDKKTIQLKKGINRVIGPWNDQIADLFQEMKALRQFQQETLPEQNFSIGTPGKYRIGFGSCMREDWDPQQKIFNRIRKLKPDAFMLIGDTVYNDLPSGMLDRPYELEEKYDRQLKIRRFRDFYKNFPIYTIWDDHDYWENDAERDSVSSENRQLSRGLFTSIFPNPSYGENGEGLYFKWSLGDIDFFMLDTRWFRRSSKSQLLGDSQYAWLQRELLNSSATFKVLVSSVQWNEKGKKGSWRDFLSERNMLFQMIFENNIKGIILLSGDAHYGAAYQLSPQLSLPGYRLTEFTSSALAVEPKEKPMLKTDEVTQLLKARKKLNFGFLEFNTTDARPYVDLKLYSPDNPASWENGETYYRIYAHQLQLPEMKTVIPDKAAFQIKAIPQQSEEKATETQTKTIDRKLRIPPQLPANSQARTRQLPVKSNRQKTISPIQVKAIAKESETHLSASPQECPEAPIFTLQKLRAKGLSEAQIQAVCHGK
ncbi:MAG: alkaline phosphatase family protein [SAR324 cluster bacterium]|nr:alkaline phosphatase family protein [SAR324 cluster bacterium]